MHQPTARYRQIGFRRVKLPVSFCQRTGITSEDGSLIELPSPPNPLIHAADRLPHPGPCAIDADQLLSAAPSRRTRPECSCPVSRRDQSVRLRP